MSRTWIAVLVVVLVVVALVGWPAMAYNRLVNMNERINGQWAQVETQLTRRFDLIPALVEAVKGYATHERELFTHIADSRAKLAGAQTVDQRVEATNQLEQALGRLLMLVENYPELKASDLYQNYMDALEGTENRLAVERMRFNEQVRDFNAAVKRFPAVLWARLFGFVPRAYFGAPPGAETAPTGK